MQMEKHRDTEQSLKRCESSNELFLKKFSNLTKIDLTLPKEGRAPLRYHTEENAMVCALKQSLSTS